VTAVDIEDMSASWLSVALEREVRSFTAQPVGTGQTGATYRLTLDDGGPTTIIAKVAAGDDAARKRVANGYRNEVGFYAHVVDTVDVRTPTCWHARSWRRALRAWPTWSRSSGRSELNVQPLPAPWQSMTTISVAPARFAPRTAALISSV